jgi:hypothetical protein
VVLCRLDFGGPEARVDLVPAGSLGWLRAVGGGVRGWRCARPALLALGCVGWLLSRAGCVAGLCCARGVGCRVSSPSRCSVVVADCAGGALTRQGRLRRPAPPDCYATLDPRASATLRQALTGRLAPAHRMPATTTEPSLSRSLGASRRGGFPSFEGPLLMRAMLKDPSLGPLLGCPERRVHDIGLVLKGAFRSPSDMNAPFRTTHPLRLRPVVFRWMAVGSLSELAWRVALRS